VVGEVRGPEVLDLLAALNTGHEGGCGTVHANAASTSRPGWKRSASPPGSTGRAAQPVGCRALLVVHLVRDRSGRRRVAEIHVLERAGTAL